MFSCAQTVFNQLISLVFTLWNNQINNEMKNALNFAHLRPTALCPAHGNWKSCFSSISEFSVSVDNTIDVYTVFHAIFEWRWNHVISVMRSVIWEIHQLAGGSFGNESKISMRCWGGPLSKYRMICGIQISSLLVNI